MTAQEEPTGQANAQSWALSQGLSVTLAVVGPVFLFSELWRGRPIIDQAGDLWLIPAGIMAIAFFIGGMIAGHRRSTSDKALGQGFLLGSLGVTLLFIVDTIRRLTRGENIPLAVLGLWAAAAAAALVVSGVGGLYGRRRTSKRAERVA